VPAGNWERNPTHGSGIPISSSLTGLWVSASRAQTRTRRWCVIVLVFSVQFSVITFLQTHHRSVFQGCSELAAKDRGDLPLNLFRTSPEERIPPFRWVVCGIIWRHLDTLYPHFSHHRSIQGLYIPLFASAIWDQNPMLIAAGLKPIKVGFVAIGEPSRCNSETRERNSSACVAFADMEHLTVSFYDVWCTSALVPPFLGIKLAQRLFRTLL